MPGNQQFKPITFTLTTIISILVGGSVFGQLNTDLAQVEVPKTQKTVKESVAVSTYLEVVNFNYKPIIAGTINGNTVYFLIDTGSDVTIINSSERKRLHFQCYRPFNKEMKATGLGNHQGTLMGTKGIEIKLSGRDINIPVFSYKLDNVVQSISELSGVEIAGIIGSDILSVYQFTIDFGSKTVSMGQPLWISLND